MQISTLRESPSLISAVVHMLHHEWSDLPNWNDADVIRQRLNLRNAADAQTLTLVATGADGALMATASIIHYELSDISERDSGWVRWSPPANIAVRGWRVRS
ncbi:hypothetical protein [Candidatus Pantoea formicae]|uniref:hypothetical protein n=1 Tax=Candidatus Pantoea formicae TaxID=2608355 RepID=UPI0034E26314